MPGLRRRGQRLSLSFARGRPGQLLGRPLPDLAPATMMKPLARELASFRNDSRSNPAVSQHELGDLHVILRLQPIYRTGSTTERS